MSVILVTNNQYKAELLKGAVNFDNSDSLGHTFKLLLMRPGYEFNIKEHLYLKNIKSTHSGSSNIDFDSATKTISITDSVGSFVNTGIAPGNRITITGTSSNNKEVTAVTVSDYEITVEESLTDESGTSATLTVGEELDTAYGYTEDGQVLTFTVEVDDDTAKSKAIADAAVEWTASGGDITASGAMLYDDTHGDDLLVAFIDFQSDQTATDGTKFTVSNIEVHNL